VDQQLKSAMRPVRAAAPDPALAELFPAEGGLQPGARLGRVPRHRRLQRHDHPASLNPDVAVMNMTFAEVSGTCCFHQVKPDVT